MVAGVEASPKEVTRVEQLLEGTPYTVDGLDGAKRFERVAQKTAQVRDRAVVAAATVAKQAEKVLPQFELAVRSDLVAESNRMEGINSSAPGIRDLARAKKDLLDQDVAAFLRFIRDDPRLLESLGLYRAYAVADEWAHSELRPREYEIRALHALMMPTLRTGGRYKEFENKIEGRDHKPIHPSEASRTMSEMADWFVQGTGDAALDAAVAHAWLAHIHPFEDGNGRMARLLANLALIQARYPPLLLRSREDRGPYLEALAASDFGDILPLFDLFAKSLRRVVKTMEHPSYVESKIRDELLATSSQRYRTWLQLAQAFFVSLDQKTRTIDWSVREMGYPSIESFELLERRDADGNCWFVKFRRHGEDPWLLWFGYRSDAMCDVIGGDRVWRSVFFAEHTTDPTSIHPYETRFDSDELRPAEISFIPGRSKPLVVRFEYSVCDVHTDEAAAIVVKALCR